ncbi:hypothetical protein LTR84_000726 [Exophiala bonariae]|uniref:Poly [ADP-ribose] polymerase n=1 Tax=Exophiala bonariae TaxID=1690606 RepID=A0AAV9NU53_9EURO|nr:hypothetical protein LTR84_000726 [Exophiala bonariae]
MVRVKAPPTVPSTSLEGVTVTFASYSASCHPDFASKTVTQLKAEIAKCGGSYASKLDQSTHLIASPAQFEKNLKAVKEALERTDVTIVDYDWLAESLKSTSAVAVDNYLLDHSSSAPAVTNGTGNANGNPIADVDSDTDTQKKPNLKRKRGKDSSAHPGAKSSTPASTQKLPTRAKPVLNIPVDEQVPNAQNFTVYVDDDGLAWDATLNQSNSNANNNKFYKLQILNDVKGSKWCWTRWGRVGEKGQSKMLGDGDFSQAKREFEKKFKDKNGNVWDNRDGPIKAGKYVYIEINYAESDDEDEDEDEPLKKKQNGTPDIDEEEDADAAPVESSLDKPVQELMKLIFDLKLFDSTMAALNYDATKMPLGKLSKKTLLKGYEVLKELAALIADPSTAASTGTSFDDAVDHRSNLYFSLVPHVSGRNRLPTLSNMDLIKREIELLETLTDMQLANDIMKMAKNKKDQEKVHVLDRQFKGLGMQEMTPLESKSKEFREIETYLMKTHGSTHGYSYKVDDIFRIERNGEDTRYQSSEFSNMGDKSDRRLLWHGSRVTNFGGILSQGLRIAPPEAPVSGYMFGKGVYLADMSSKSAGYCASYNTNGTGLLLLCEAELGTPPLKLNDSDYNAGEHAQEKGLISTWGVGQTAPLAWKDAGAIHSSLKGVRMPDVAKKAPGPTNEDGAWLLYNEYIVYDVSQIKLKYLLRVKM